MKIIFKCSTIRALLIDVSRIPARSFAVATARLINREAKVLRRGEMVLLF